MVVSQVRLDVRHDFLEERLPPDPTFFGEDTTRPGRACCASMGEVRGSVANNVHKEGLGLLPVAPAQVKFPQVMFGLERFGVFGPGDAMRFCTTSSNSGPACSGLPEWE